MKYVVISEKGEVKEFSESHEVDVFLTKSDGVYYIVNIYGNYVYVDKYAVVSGKIHLVDSVTL